MNTINIRGQNNYSYEHVVYPYDCIVRTSDTDKRLNIQSGQGAWLIDKYGRRYLDAISGLWNVSLGYNNKRINDTIKNQIENITYCSLFDHTNDIVIENSNKILNLHNANMKKVSYVCSGSEANELAIKIMRKYWYDRGHDNKKIIMSLERCYHGTSYGALTISLEENELLSPYKPGLEATGKFDICRQNPDNCKCKSNCQYCSRLESYILKESKHIAGIVIEPILLSMGIKDICPILMNKLISMCKENDILITVDEVATGFYRTGQAFYYQTLGIEPDLVSMSKGIDSGYLPLGAVCIGEKIVNGIAENTVLLHGSTQGGNTLSCAVSNTCIDIYKGMFDNNTKLRLVQDFVQELKLQLNDTGLIGNVNSKGFLVCLEFDSSKYNINYNDIIQMRDEIKKGGLIVYPSRDGILMLPMFINTQKDYEAIILKLKKYFSYC